MTSTWLCTFNDKVALLAFKLCKLGVVDRQDGLILFYRQDIFLDLSVGILLIKSITEVKENSLFVIILCAVICVFLFSCEIMHQLIVSQ